MSTLQRFLLVPVLGFVLAGPACADGYSENPDAQAVIAELVAEEGFDAGDLSAVFAAARHQQSIIDAMTRPAEKTKPWYEYRKIFVTDRRRNEGVAFYQLHRDTLARAEATFGVPAEIIVSIIGVETYYGRIAGSYRVVDALATLAFDYPKRAPFFRRELKHYLVLTREQGMDPLSLKGSYAGAMGYGQFMPSSYRGYAVDFDDDGKVDIWNNPVDAIGSVANYFREHGWQAGQPVTFAATAAPGLAPELFKKGLKPVYTVGELAAAGFTSAATLPAETPATAMRFEGEDGPQYWLGLPNFYAITRYNHSAMYAMSVYQLSQDIAGSLP